MPAAAGLFVLVVLSCAFISSCASGPADYQRIIKNAYSGENPPDKLNSGLIKKAMVAGHASPGDYRIGPGDLLRISVFQVSELDATARVSQRGRIILPLTGSVKAAGETTAGLASVIARKLGIYLENPVVTVFVKEYRSRTITVLGAVNKPRVFAVAGRKYLLDMLSMAGGLTQDASNICIVRRRTPRGTEVMRINLKDLLTRGRADLNIPLFSGDIVNVPPAGRFFVDGAVREPGAYKLQGKTTLTQAISMARGLDFEAEKKIRIYRDAGRGRRKLIFANYDSILDGKSPDVCLRNKDVVIVPKNGLKAVIGGLRGTVFTGPLQVGQGY